MATTIPGVTVPTGSGFFVMREDGGAIVTTDSPPVVAGTYTVDEMAQAAQDNLNADATLVNTYTVGTTQNNGFEVLANSAWFNISENGGLNVETSAVPIPAGFYTGVEFAEVWEDHLNDPLNGLTEAYLVSYDPFDNEFSVSSGGTIEFLNSTSGDLNATTGVAGLSDPVVSTELTTTVLVFTVTSDGSSIAFDEPGNVLGELMNMFVFSNVPLIGDAINGVVNTQTTVAGIGRQTQLALDYLPQGKSFGARWDITTNLYNLFKGFGRSFANVAQDLADLKEEVMPDRTTLFLEEWESALGIPDQCIPLMTSQETRRTMILTKLVYMNIQTEADFIELALKAFGLVVTVTPGWDRFDAGNPDGFADAREARFTIVITFVAADAESFEYLFNPATTPTGLPFGSLGVVILSCLYGKLKPSNCNVIFIGN
jgi:uncharacterized protein YmfQ (DUF2313 family)